MKERELLSSVKLTRSNGRLNHDAVGWSRRPLIDTSGIGGRHEWGRNKRWEYWNIVTPTHIAALTISSLDYAAVHELWVLDRETEKVWQKQATVLPARGVHLPSSLDADVVRAKSGGFQAEITPTDDGVRIRAAAKGVKIDAQVTRPKGHECLAVVVPWNEKLFQYTVKDVALNVAGTISLDGEKFPIPTGDSWAVLDHGRGRWPYRVTWNWGAGSGKSNERTIGVQVGGKWADGTGSTENGLLVDGKLHKISSELTWEYDLETWRNPWRISGGGFDASFAPIYNKQSHTNLGILGNRTDQCFGYWSGQFTTKDGDVIEFSDIFGWAEEVSNRW